MSSMVDSGKSAVERGKSAFAGARERWTWLEHLIQMVQRYNDRRGNLYAASISFNGILALVPIVMVVFAIAGFVLANQPELLKELQDAVVKNMPEGLGDQVSDLIDSAIASRAAVGIVGLIGAAFTGIGWISGVRLGMTEMWGGRVNRNAVMSKVWDLITFVVLGLAFAGTMALTALGNSGLTTEVLSWVGLEDASWAPAVIRTVSIIVSVMATWLLFTFVMSRLPLVQLPFRNTLKAGLLTAIAFEIVKTVGGIYLQSVLSGPAGVAFGPIIGLLVFAYLASRIVLYAAAWCATDPINEEFQVTEEDAPLPPVVVSPNYQVNPVARPATLVAVAGIAAAISGFVGWLLRR
ncbi:YhjD/YihY/BrkB family envelope integrity protein [Gordonia sp. SL306]|uniref:YhjD/YihY/BrkB family envelope integrity protein n=1 Tax=Gordonia sp. SL306 TaxID=2995145 RepID=UPI00226F2240|nr:YhjD/YihY/BrkB family envelope integrity protein [Gordonia sp. SL306]WAC54768.1 YihY/virulence factor BrkB family protein [Gordonia sp. SL306]